MFTEIVHVLDRLRPELGNNVVDALRDAFAVCNQYLRHRGPMQLITSFSDFNLVDVTLQSQELQAGLEVQNPAGFIDDDNILHDGAAAHFIGPVIMHAGDAIPAAAAGDDFGGGGGGASDVQPVNLFNTASMVNAGDILLNPNNDADGGDLLFQPDGNGAIGLIGNVPGNINVNGGVVLIWQPGAGGGLVDDEGEQVFWNDIDGYANCTVATVDCDGTHLFVPKYFFGGSYGLYRSTIIDVWTTFGAGIGDDETGQLNAVTLTDQTNVERGTGIVGTNALDFAGGSSDWVSFPRSPIDTSDDFTISFWFKPASLTGRQVIICSDDTSGATPGDNESEIKVGLDANGKPFAEVGNTDTSWTSATATGGEAVIEDVWNFMAMTWSQHSQTVSIDSCPVGTDWDDHTHAEVEFGEDITDATGLVAIGTELYANASSSGGIEAGGLFDGLFLESRTATDDDLRWLFNNGDGQAFL